jgi:hypothetical protein
MTPRRVTSAAGGKEIYVNKITSTPTDSRPSSTNALKPGSYVLDVRRAVEHLAGGRVAGVCKVCAREFRIPNDCAEWRSFLQALITHPLEHESSPAMKEQVNQVLEAMDSISPESAQGMLAEELANYREHLEAHGFLARIRHDS